MPAVSKNPHPLSPLILDFTHVTETKPNALLSCKLNTKGEIEHLRGRPGGMAGKLQRIFKDKIRVHEKDTKALKFVISRVEEHSDCFSADIAKHGLAQLNELCVRPLGKDVRMSAVTDILQGMVKRQQREYEQAATRAHATLDDHSALFQGKNALPHAQLLPPDRLISNVQDLSDAYQVHSTSAAQNQSAATPTMQSNALERVANALQVLQTTVNTPGLAQAQALKTLWMNLPCPEDFNGARDPKGSYRYIAGQLNACKAALLALAPALEQGDFNEARTCCTGYIACLDDLVLYLTQTGSALLTQLNENTWPTDLGPADKVALLEVGKALLDAAQLLMVKGSPLMANLASARTLLSLNDAALSAWHKFGSRTHQNDPTPRTRRATSDGVLPSPRSPRLPPLIKTDEELQRGADKRKKAQNMRRYTVVNKKTFLTPDTHSPSVAQPAPTKPVALPQQLENDGLFRPLSPRPEQHVEHVATPRPTGNGTSAPRLDLLDVRPLPEKDGLPTKETHKPLPLVPAVPQPTTPEGELGVHLKKMEGQQSRLLDIHKVTGSPTATGVQPPPLSSGAPAPEKKPEAQMEDDLSKLFEALERAQPSKFSSLAPSNVH